MIIQEHSRVYQIIEPTLTRRSAAGAVLTGPKAARMKRDARVVLQPIAPGQGQALWAELHQRALQQEGQDDSAWLAAFAAKLPCGECRRHWLALITMHPPTWDAYFTWTVDRHNDVNQRLCKPLMTLPAASLQWAPPAAAGPLQTPVL